MVNVFVPHGRQLLAGGELVVFFSVAVGRRVAIEKLYLYTASVVLVLCCGVCTSSGCSR